MVILGDGYSMCGFDRVGLGIPSTEIASFLLHGQSTHNFLWPGLQLFQEKNNSMELTQCKNGDFPIHSYISNFFYIFTDEKQFLELDLIL